MLSQIDWIGDDGLFEHDGRQVSIQRLGDDVYAIAEVGAEDDVETVVGNAGLSYWLRRWLRE